MRKQYISWGLFPAVDWYSFRWINHLIISFFFVKYQLFLCSSFSFFLLLQYILRFGQLGKHDNLKRSSWALGKWEAFFRHLLTKTMKKTIGWFICNENNVSLQCNMWLIDVFLTEFGQKELCGSEERAVWSFGYTHTVLISWISSWLVLVFWFKMFVRKIWNVSVWTHNNSSRSETRCRVDQMWAVLWVCVDLGTQYDWLLQYEVPLMLCPPCLHWDWVESLRHL